MSSSGTNSTYIVDVRRTFWFYSTCHLCFTDNTTNGKHYLYIYLQNNAIQNNVSDSVGLKKYIDNYMYFCLCFLTIQLRKQKDFIFAIEMTMYFLNLYLFELKNRYLLAITNSTLNIFTNNVLKKHFFFHNPRNSPDF